MPWTHHSCLGILGFPGSHPPRYPPGLPWIAPRKHRQKKIEVLLGMLIEINGGFSSKPLLTIGTPILANIYSFIIH
jgi:hypothetical protein